MGQGDERTEHAGEIAAFIEERAAELAARLGSAHSWANWPRFLYHVTDVTNAASILAHGRVFSRRRAEEAGLLRTDSASPGVIAQTDPWVLDSVRLYFRPLTPTFVHTEGIRPVGLRSGFEAHCPMPVAFLFDSVTVLSRSSIRVSDGNLAARRRRVGHGLAFLRSLPWEWIYHERVPRNAAEQELATFHRHAEVAVPEELLLDGALRFIGVRTAAEFETLRTLAREAGGQEAARWLRHALVDRRARLFFQRWSFVESVALDQATGQLRVAFNPMTETPAPFDAIFEFVDRDSGQVIRETWQDFRADRPVRLALPAAVRASPFRFSVRLDGCLAYANEFDPTAKDVLARLS